MKKLFSLLISVAMLLSCFLVVNVAAEAGTPADLKARAYIVAGDAVNVYVVFSHKVTDVGQIWVTDQAGNCVRSKVNTLLSDTVVQYARSGATFADDARNGQTLCFAFGQVPPVAENAEFKDIEKVLLWADQDKYDSYVLPVTEVDSLDDVPGTYVDVPADDNTGDDNTGDDNTGDDNTGDDNTGDDTPVVVAPLTGKTYTVKGDMVTLYIVFNQDVVLGDGCSFVIAPAGILVNPVVVDDHIVSVSNEEYPPALFVKSGYNGTPQACYIWTNAITGADGSKLVCDDSVTVWGQSQTLCLFEYAGEVDSVDALPSLDDFESGDDNTGDDNTGDDNTGDDNTGDDNTGDDTPVVVAPLTGKTYTVKGDMVTLYIVFNQDVVLGDGCSFVIAPAGILVNPVVVDDHIVSVSNEEYPPALFVKSGYNGTPQACYIWTNAITGADGSKLVCDDSVTVWGQSQTLCLFEYAGEVDSVDDLPSLDNAEGGDNAGTGDSTMAVGAVVVVACAAALIAVSKKKRVH